MVKGGNGSPQTCSTPYRSPREDRLRRGTVAFEARMGRRQPSMSTGHHPRPLTTFVADTSGYVETKSYEDPYEEDAEDTTSSSSSLGSLSSESLSSRYSSCSDRSHSCTGSFETSLNDSCSGYGFEGLEMEPSSGLIERHQSDLKSGDDSGSNRGHLVLTLKFNIRVLFAVSVLCIYVYAVSSYDHSQHAVDGGREAFSNRPVTSTYAAHVESRATEGISRESYELQRRNSEREILAVEIKDETDPYPPQPKSKEEKEIKNGKYEVVMFEDQDQESTLEGNQGDQKFEDQDQESTLEGTQGDQKQKHFLTDKNRPGCKIQKTEQIPVNTSVGTIYSCSHWWLFSSEYDGLGSDLFPDFIPGGPVQEADSDTFTEHDIVITHPGYECDQGGVEGYPDHPDLRIGRGSGPWDFPGRILYVNGEWHMGDQVLVDPRDYHLGYLPDSTRTRRVYWLGILLMYGPFKARRDAILDPTKKPKPNTKQHFLLYAASNCVAYREDAFDALSIIGDVHYGGNCRGTELSTTGGNSIGSRIQPAPRREYFRREKQGINLEFYHDYRFALVMENKAAEGYISEKILNAFYAGSIPIWYGTKEIFDIFNDKAMIYYDVDDPKSALERVSYLEGNRSAYEQMLNEPILANGDETIARHFSFSDEVGYGVMKTRIRRMLDLPEDLSSVVRSE